MAPSVAASQAYPFSDGGAGHVCTFTAGAPAVGDWDVLCVNSDTTVSTPAGFTLNPSRVNFQGAYVFRRKAAGGEGATVTVTTTGDHPTHVIWVRLSGANAADVVAVNGVDGSVVTTTPALSSGALAASGEIAVAFAALHSFTTIPASLVWGSSYTAVTSGNQGAGATAPFGAVAYKTPVGTAAEAPGLSWTNATNDAYMLFISFTAAAGGTTFTQSLSGSLTSSGALAKRTNKPLSGSLTSSGAIAKRIGKTFSGSVTSTGTLSVTKVVLLALAGTLTASGTLLRRTGKGLTGSITPTGTVTRSLVRTLAGSATPAGAVTRRTAKSVAGSVTSSGTLAKTVGKALAGTLTAAGALIKRTAKTLAGSTTAAGSVTTQGGTVTVSAPGSMALATTSGSTTSGSSSAGFASSSSSGSATTSTIGGGL